MDNAEIGDWVQATEEIVETFPNGAVCVHALPGAIGHVMEVDLPWFTVTWERTETTTDCHGAELRWLCNAALGRAVIGDRDVSR